MEWSQHSPDSLVEHTLQIPLRESRTLQILVRSDLLSHEQGLVVRHRLHSLGPQALQRCRVFSQVKLGADEDDGDGRGVVVDFWEPLDTHSVSGARNSGFSKTAAYLCSDVVK
jgi:hypothetical protein